MSVPVNCNFACKSSESLQLLGTLHRIVPALDVESQYMQKGPLQLLHVKQRINFFDKQICFSCQTAKDGTNRLESQL